MSIQLEHIQSFVPNASTLKNGKALFSGNKFSQFSKNAEGDLLFAYCQGSGREAYLTSADFLLPDAPVFRCSCPSRQFPCKHNAGLLFAIANQVVFELADVPESLVSKREKSEKRLEKKTQQRSDALNAVTDQPKLKVNRSALKKRIQAQLEGLGLAHTLLQDIVKQGLGSLNQQQINAYDDTVERLTGAYLPGVTAAFKDLFLLTEAGGHDDYLACIKQLNYISALVSKGQTYLQARLEDESLSMDTTCAIEEQLGYPWKLDELIALKQCQQDADLVQCSFYVHSDEAKQSFIDEGIWIHLQSGQIYKTQNIRPYRAKKHIQAADTETRALHIPLLVVYPGEGNPRVRWDYAEPRALSAEHRQLMIESAQTDFDLVAKMAKNLIKNPLNDKHPIYLLKVSAIYKQGNRYVIADQADRRLILGNHAYFIEDNEVHDSLTLIEDMLPSDLSSFAMCVMFHSDLDSNELIAKPLSWVMPDKLVRLMY